LKYGNPPDRRGINHIPPGKIGVTAIKIDGTAGP